MTDALHGRLTDALGGTYTIERELSGGGMSRVFVATERALDRRVAIKVLNRSGPVDTERFRREMLLSARLQHPHIVPVLTAAEIEGLPYFVMPFVEGVTVRDRLRDQGPLAIGEGTRILRNVAAALYYAHQRGIVHRDIKPDNVLVSGGAAVVLDFGVAKAITASTLAADATVTGVGLVVGTPAYMAPEQASGDPLLDHRADLYAFGILGYEMFTTSTPFGGPPHEVLRRHLAEPPPDVAARRPELPPPIADLIMRCLAKDPADRPDTAAQVLDVLDGVATPVATRRASGPARAARGRWLEALAVPTADAASAVAAVGALAHYAAQEVIPDRMVAIAVIASLLGLPLAIGAGLLLRVRLAEVRTAQVR